MGNIRNKTESQFEKLNSDQSVYEVIRIIDGVALFLEDHFNRLRQSMKIQGIPFHMDCNEFKHNIQYLAEENKTLNGNIRFVYLKAKNEIKWTFSIIPHSYPARDEYLKGVTTNLFFAERENPNAKVIQATVREGANKMIADQKLYEVLLVNRDGLITEGSRSNVFFVKDNVFYTSPASTVLVGVTRKKVIECLTELEFLVIEKAVRSSEISSYDAVFLTGTSPVILPVRSIGNKIIDTSHPLVRRLMEQFNILITMYIQNEKNNSEE